MLGTAKVMTFLAVTDRERARAFYAEDLGLTFVADEPSALVFDANGVMLRISPLERVTPAPYTVLGWGVEDIRGTIARLGERGIIPERFPGLPLDEAGVCGFPNGDQVAWFKDPDGNLLSVTQFAARVASERPRFKSAFPISGNVQALPVKDLGPAIAYYTRVLGFEVVSRTGERAKLRRDDAVIGLEKNDADPEQTSVYFAVENLAALHAELTGIGAEPSGIGPSEHGGQKYTVFFAKEPYGVCFCFGEPQ